MNGSRCNCAITRDGNFYDEKCIFPSARQFSNKDAANHLVVASFLGLLIWVTAMACSKDLYGETAMQQIEVSSQKCQSKSKKSEIAATVKNDPKDSLSDNPRLSSQCDRKVPLVAYSGRNFFECSAPNKTELNCNWLSSDARTRNETCFQGEYSNVDNRVHEQKQRHLSSESNKDTVCKNNRILNNDAVDPQKPGIFESKHKEVKSLAPKSEKPTIFVSSSSEKTKFISNSGNLAVAVGFSGQSTKTGKERVTVSIPVPDNEVITVDSVKREIEKHDITVHTSQGGLNKNATPIQREFDTTKSKASEKRTSTSDMKSPKMNKMFQILLNLDKTEREKKSNQKKTMSLGDVSTEQTLPGKNRSESEKDEIPVKSKPLPRVFRNFSNDASHQGSWWNYKPKYDSRTRDFESRRRHWYSPLESRRTSSSRESSADRNLNRYPKQFPLSSNRNQNRNNHWSAKSRQLVADFLKGLNESENRSLTYTGSPPEAHPHRNARGYPVRTCRQVTRPIPDRKRTQYCERNFDEKRNSVQFNHGNDVHRRSGTPSSVRELRFAETPRRPSVERNQGCDRISNFAKNQCPKREFATDNCYPDSRQSRGYSPDTFPGGSKDIESCNTNKKHSFEANECPRIQLSDGRCRSKSMDQSLLANFRAAGTLGKRHQSSPHLDILEVSKSKSCQQLSQKSPTSAEHQCFPAPSDKSGSIQILDTESQMFLLDIESESNQSEENTSLKLFVELKHDEKDVVVSKHESNPSSSYEQSMTQTDSKTLNLAQDETNKALPCKLEDRTFVAKGFRELFPNTDTDCTDESKKVIATVNGVALLAASTDHSKKLSRSSKDLVTQTIKDQQVKDEVCFDKPLQSIPPSSLSGSLSETHSESICESRERTRYPKTIPTHAIYENKITNPYDDTTSECIETQGEKNSREPKRPDDAFGNKKLKNQLTNETCDVNNELYFNVKQYSNPRRHSTGTDSRTNENTNTIDYFSNNPSPKILSSTLTPRITTLPDKRDHVVEDIHCSKATQDNSNIKGTNRQQISSKVAPGLSSYDKSDDVVMSKYRWICRKFLSSIHSDSSTKESNFEENCSIIEHRRKKTDYLLKTNKTENRVDKYSPGKFSVKGNHESGKVTSTPIPAVRNQQKNNSGKSIAPKDDKINLTESRVKNIGVNVPVSSAAENVKKVNVSCKFIKKSSSMLSHDKDLPKEFKTCIHRVVPLVDLLKFENDQVKKKEKSCETGKIFTSIRHPPRKFDGLVVMEPFPPKQRDSSCRVKTISDTGDDDQPQIDPRDKLSLMSEVDVPVTEVVHENNASLTNASSPTCAASRLFKPSAIDPSSTQIGDDHEDKNEITNLPISHNLKLNTIPTEYSEIILGPEKNIIQESVLLKRSDENKNNPSNSLLTLSENDTDITLARQDSSQKKQNIQASQEAAGDDTPVELSEEESTNLKSKRSEEMNERTQKSHDDRVCNDSPTIEHQVDLITTGALSQSSELNANPSGLKTKEQETPPVSVKETLENSVSDKVHAFSLSGEDGDSERESLLNNRPENVCSKLSVLRNPTDERDWLEKTSSESKMKKQTSAEVDNDQKEFEETEACVSSGSEYFGVIPENLTDQTDMEIEISQDCQREENSVVVLEHDQENVVFSVGLATVSKILDKDGDSSLRDSKSTGSICDGMTTTDVSTIPKIGKIVTRPIDTQLSIKFENTNLVVEGSEISFEKPTKDHNTVKDLSVELDEIVLTKPDIKCLPVKPSDDVTTCVVENSDLSESNLACHSLNVKPTSFEPKSPVVEGSSKNNTQPLSNISKPNVETSNENTSFESSVFTANEEKDVCINTSHFEDKQYQQAELNIITNESNDETATSEYMFTEFESKNRVSNDHSNASECSSENQYNLVMESAPSVMESADNPTMDADIKEEEIQYGIYSESKDLIQFSSVSTIEPPINYDVHVPKSEINERSSDESDEISEPGTSIQFRDTVEPDENCDNVDDSSSSHENQFKEEQCGNSDDPWEHPLIPELNYGEVPSLSFKPTEEVEKKSLEEIDDSDSVSSCQLGSFAKVSECPVDISKPDNLLTKCTTYTSIDDSTTESTVSAPLNPCSSQNDDMADICLQELGSEAHSTENESASKLGVISQIDSSSQNLEEYDNGSIEITSCEGKSSDVVSTDLDHRSNQPHPPFEIAECSADNGLVEAESKSSSTEDCSFDQQPELENNSTVILPQEFISEVSESTEPNNANLAVLSAAAVHEFDYTSPPDETVVVGTETALSADHACSSHPMVDDVDVSASAEEPVTNEGLDLQVNESAIQNTNRSLAPATFPDFVPNCDIAFFSDPESNFADNHDNYFSPVCDYSSEVTIYSSEVEECHTDQTINAPTIFNEKEHLVTSAINEENSKRTKITTKSKPGSEKKKGHKTNKKLQKPLGKDCLDVAVDQKIKEETCSALQTVDLNNGISETHAEQKETVQIPKNEHEPLEKSQHIGSSTAECTLDDISDAQQQGEAQIIAAQMEMCSGSEKVKTELVSECKRPKRERRARISKSFVDHDTPSDEDTLLVPHSQIEPKRVSKKEKGFSKKHFRKIKSNSKTNTTKREDPLSVFDLTDYSDEEDIFEFNSSSYLNKCRKPMPKIRKYLLRSDQRYKESSQEVSTSVDQNAGSRNPAIPLVRLEESLNVRSSHFLQSRGYIPVETRREDDTDEGNEDDSRRVAKKSTKKTSSGDLKIILSLTKNEGNNYSSSIRVKESKESTEIIKNESQSQKKQNKTTAKQVGNVEAKPDTKSPHQRLRGKCSKRKYTSGNDDPTTALNNMLSSPEYLPDVGIDVTEKLKNMNSKDFETTLKNELQRIIDKQDGELTSNVEPRLTGVAVSHDSYSEELRKKASRTKEKLDSMKISKYKGVSLKLKPKQRRGALYKIEKTCKETILNRVYLKRVAKRLPEDEALCRKLSQAITDSSNDESDGEARVNRSKNRVVPKAISYPRTGAGRGYNIKSGRSTSVNQPNTHSTEKKIKATTSGKKKGRSPSLGSVPGMTPNSNHSDDDSCSNLINILNSSSSESFSSSPCPFDTEKGEAKSPVKSVGTFRETSLTSSGVSKEHGSVPDQKLDETDQETPPNTLEQTTNPEQSLEENSNDKVLIDCQSNSTSECLPVTSQKEDINPTHNKDIIDMPALKRRVGDEKAEHSSIPECNKEVAAVVSESNYNDQSVNSTDNAAKLCDAESVTHRLSDDASEPADVECAEEESHTDFKLDLKDGNLKNSDVTENVTEGIPDEVEQKMINEFVCSGKNIMEPNANNSSESNHTGFEKFDEWTQRHSTNGENSEKNIDSAILNRSQISNTSDEDSFQRENFPRSASYAVSTGVSQELSTSAISDNCVDQNEGKRHVTSKDYEEPNKMNHEEPSKMNYEEPNKMNHEEPSKMNHEKPNKMNHEEPNNMNHEEPNKMNHEEPNNMNHEEPNNMNHEEPNNMNHEEPNKMNHEEPNNMNHEEPNNMNHEEPNKMNNEEPNKMNAEELNNFEASVDTAQPSNNISANETTIAQPTDCCNQTTLPFGLGLSKDDTVRVADTNKEDNSVNPRTELPEVQNQTQNVTVDGNQDHSVNFDDSGSGEDSRIIVTNINDILDKLEFGSGVKSRECSNQTSRAISKLHTNDSDQRLEEQSISADTVPKVPSGKKSENDTIPSESFPLVENVPSSSLEENVSSSCNEKINNQEDNGNAIRHDQTTCVGQNVSPGDVDPQQRSHQRQISENASSFQPLVSEGQSTEGESEPRDVVVRDLLDIDVTAKRKRKRVSIDNSARKKKVPKTASEKGEQEVVSVPASATNSTGVGGQNPNCVRLSFELPGFNWLEEKIRLSSVDEAIKSPNKDAKKKTVKAKTDKTKTSPQSINLKTSELSRDDPHPPVSSATSNQQLTSSSDFALSIAQNPVLYSPTSSSDIATTTVAISIVSPAGVVVVQHGSSSLSETTTTTANVPKCSSVNLTNKSTSGLPTSSGSVTCTVSPILWDILATNENSRTQSMNINTSNSSCSSSTNSNTTNTSMSAVDGSTVSWPGEITYERDQPGQQSYAAVGQMTQQPPNKSRVLCRIPHLQAAVPPAGPSLSQRCRAVPKRAPARPKLVQPSTHPQKYSPTDQYHLLVRYPQVPSKTQHASFSQLQSPFGHHQPQYGPHVQYPLYPGQQPHYHRQGHYPPHGYHQSGQYPQHGNPPYKGGHPHQAAYASHQSQYPYQDHLGRKLPLQQQHSDVGLPSQYLVRAQLPHNQEYSLNPQNAHQSLNHLQRQAVENVPVQLDAQQAHTGRQIVQPSQNRESGQIPHPKPNQNVHHAQHAPMTQNSHQTLNPQQLPTAHQYLLPQQDQSMYHAQTLQPNPYTRDAQDIQHSSNAKMIPQKHHDLVSMHPQTATQHLDIKNSQSLHQKNIQHNLAQQQPQAVHYSQQASASQYNLQQTTLNQSNFQNTGQHLSHNQLHTQGHQNAAQAPQLDKVHGSLASSSILDPGQDLVNTKSSFVDPSFRRLPGFSSTSSPAILTVKNLTKPSSSDCKVDDKKSENLRTHKIPNSSESNESSDLAICVAKNRDSLTTSRFKEVTDRYYQQMIQQSLHKELPQVNSQRENPAQKVSQTEPCFQSTQPCPSTSLDSVADQPPGLVPYNEYTENRTSTLQRHIAESFLHEETEQSGVANTSSHEPRRLKKCVYSVSNTGLRSLSHDAEVKEDCMETKTPLNHGEQNQATATVAETSRKTEVTAVNNDSSSDHPIVISQLLKSTSSNLHEVEGMNCRNLSQKERPAATNQLRKMLQLFRDKLGKTMANQSTRAGNKTDQETPEISVEGNKAQSVEKELLRILENLTEASEKLRKQHPGQQNLELEEKPCDSSSFSNNTENTRFLIQQRIKEIKERITCTIVSELGKKAAEDFQSTMNRTSSSGDEPTVQVSAIRATTKESTLHSLVEAPDKKELAHGALTTDQTPNNLDEHIKNEDCVTEDVRPKARLSEIKVKNINEMKTEQKNVLRIVKQKDDKKEQWKCTSTEEMSNAHTEESKMSHNDSSKTVWNEISSCVATKDSKNSAAQDDRTNTKEWEESSSIGIQYSSNSTPNSPNLLMIETSNSEFSSEEKPGRGASPAEHLDMSHSKLPLDASSSSVDSVPMKYLTSEKHDVSASDIRLGKFKSVTTAKVKDFYGNSKKKMASNKYINIDELSTMDNFAEDAKEKEHCQLDAKQIDVKVSSDDNEESKNTSSTQNDSDVMKDEMLDPRPIATTLKPEEGKPASKQIEGNMEKLVDRDDAGDDKTSVPGRNKKSIGVKSKKSFGNRSEKKSCGPKARGKKKSTTEIDLLREELERTRREVEELRMRQDRMFKEKMEMELQKFNPDEKSDNKCPSELSPTPITVNNLALMSEKEETVQNTDPERVSSVTKSASTEKEDLVEYIRNEDKGQQDRSVVETHKPDDKSLPEIQCSTSTTRTEQSIDRGFSEEPVQIVSSNKQQPDTLKSLPYDTLKAKSNDCNVAVSSSYLDQSYYASDDNHPEQLHSWSPGPLCARQNNSDQFDQSKSSQNVDEQHQSWSQGSICAGQNNSDQFDQSNSSNNANEQRQSWSQGSICAGQSNSDQFDRSNSSQNTNVDEIMTPKAAPPGRSFRKSQTDFEKLRRLNPELEILRVNDTSSPHSVYDTNKEENYEHASITLIDPRPSDSRVPPKKRTKMMWDSGSVAVSSGSSSPAVTAVEVVAKSDHSMINENKPLASSNKEASNVNEGLAEIIPIRIVKSADSQGNNKTFPIPTDTGSFTEHRRFSDPCTQTQSNHRQFHNFNAKIQSNESSRPMEPHSESHRRPMKHFSQTAETKKQDLYHQMNPNQHSHNMPMNMEENDRQKSYQTVWDTTCQQPSKQSMKRKGTYDQLISAFHDNILSSQSQTDSKKVKQRSASTSRKNSADYAKSEQRPSSEPKTSSVPSASGYRRTTQGPSSDPYAFHSSLKLNEDQSCMDLDITRSSYREQRHPSAFNRPMNSSNSSSRQDSSFVQPESPSSSKGSHHHSSINQHDSSRHSPVEIVCVNNQNRKRKASEVTTSSANKEYKQTHNVNANSSDLNSKSSSRRSIGNEPGPQAEDSSRVASSRSLDEKSPAILPVPSRPSLPFDEQRTYPPLPTKPIVLRHPLPVQPKALHPLRSNQNLFHTNSPLISNPIGNVSNLAHSFGGTAFNQPRKSPSAGFSQHEAGLSASAVTSAGTSSNQLKRSYTASNFLQQQAAAATMSLRGSETESGSQPPPSYPNSINSMAHPHSATLAQLAHEQELTALYHQRLPTARYPTAGYEQQHPQQVPDEFASNKKIAESQQKDWRTSQSAYPDQTLKNQHYQRQKQHSENQMQMSNLLQNQTKANHQNYPTSSQQLQNQYMQDLLNKQQQFDSDKARYEQYRLYQAFQQQNLETLNHRQNAVFSQSEKQYHEHPRLGLSVPAGQLNSNSGAGTQRKESQNLPLNLQKQHPDRERNSTLQNPNHRHPANECDKSQTVRASTSASHLSSFSKPQQAHPNPSVTNRVPKSYNPLRSPNTSLSASSFTRSSGRSKDSGLSSTSSAESETAPCSTPTNTRHKSDGGPNNRERAGARGTQSPLCCVCGKTATIRCPQCKKTEYCNESCRFSHWVTHSKDCLKMGGMAITMHRKNKDITYY